MDSTKIIAAAQEQIDLALAADAITDAAERKAQADAYAAQLKAALDADAAADAAVLKAKDDALAALKAQFDAYKLAHPDTTPVPLPPDSPPTTPPPPTGTFDPLTLTTSNTGVPANTVLTKSGSINTGKDGQIIQNLDVNGRITVAHKNVTIKNCRITNTEYYAIFAPDDRGADVSNLVVDHCTIIGGVNAIAGKGTFNRNNLSKCDNGVNVWGPSTITENYIHDLGSVLSAGTGHNDGIENNGSGMTLLRNRIECSNQNDTSAVMTNNEFGPLVNILIDGNYLSGGQYTLYCDNRKNPANPVSNFIVTNNTIKKGAYGHAALYTSGVVIGPSNKLI